MPKSFDIVRVATPQGNGIWMFIFQTVKNTGNLPKTAKNLPSTRETFLCFKV